MGNLTLQQGEVAQSTPSTLPSSSVVCHHSPMKRVLLFPVLFLTLLVGNPVFSADFQKGLKAYQQGDYATALKEWKPLAEQGHTDAQINLGSMYLQGEGVPKNDKAAIKWYRLAAEQGHALAQFRLGEIYSQGEGVLQNYETALKAYAPAAEQGHAIAQFKLGEIYSQGEGALQNYKVAFKWYKLAAEQGDDHDQLKLGLMYAILEDYVYAHMWFNVSALAGNKKAVKQREIVSRKMTPSQITKAQRLASEYAKKDYKRPKVERKEKPTLFLR